MDYINQYIPPSTLRGFESEITNSTNLSQKSWLLTKLDSPYTCYQTRNTNNSSVYPISGTAVTLYYSTTPYENNTTRAIYVYGFVTPDGEFKLQDTQNFIGSQNYAITNENNCIHDISYRPLFYGATYQEGGSYPTETIFTLLSIMLFIFIVWSVYRIFLYPFWRRIRR